MALKEVWKDVITTMLYGLEFLFGNVKNCFYLLGGVALALASLRFLTIRSTRSNEHTRELGNRFSECDIFPILGVEVEVQKLVKRRTI